MGIRFKLGDFIQFRNTEGIFMKVIALHNWLKYRKHKDYKNYNGGATHSAIITRIEGNTIWLAEAVGIPFKEFEYSVEWLENQIKEKKIWIRRPIYPVKDVYKHASKYFGRKYDWMSIYGIFIKSIFGFESKISNKFKGDDFLICSEGSLRIGYDMTNKKLDLTKEWNSDNDFIPPICIDLSKQFSDVTI